MAAAAASFHRSALDEAIASGATWPVPIVLPLLVPGRAVSLFPNERLPVRVGPASPVLELYARGLRLVAIVHLTGPGAASELSVLAAVISVERNADGGATVVTVGRRRLALQSFGRDVAAPPRFAHTSMPFGSFTLRPELVPVRARRLLRGRDARSLATPPPAYRMACPALLATRCGELYRKRVERRRLLDWAGDGGDADTGELVPTDPLALSFFLGSRLTLASDQREAMLEEDCVVVRLRRSFRLLQETADPPLVCARCGVVVAATSCLFTVPGSQGACSAYVNPHGAIHQTLTLSAACRDAFRLAADPPTAQDSWFPGYEWSIASCARCGNHAGWLFTRPNDSAETAGFWGITRGAVREEGPGPETPERLVAASRSLVHVFTEGELSSRRARGLLRSWLRETGSDPNRSVGAADIPAMRAWAVRRGGFTEADLSGSDIEGDDEASWGPD